MSDFRHHRASREIIFVPVPVGGSPEPFREVKPGQFKRNPPTHWRPAQAIPSKGKATLELMRQIAAQETILRGLLRPQPR
jgi:hypothetical protein